jgi:hypothetical protein
MSVSQLFNGFSSNTVRNWILRHSSVSFSLSFATSCRFWLAANSIWAALVVAACIPVGMRLRMVNMWPIVTFVVFLSACLVIWELRKSKLSLKTLLILMLGVASTGFLLWPSLTRGAFVSVAGDTFFYSTFGQYVADHHRRFAFGLSPIDQLGAVLSETFRLGTASVLSLFSVLFHTTTAEALPIFTFIVLLNIFSGFVLLSRRSGCNRLFSLAAGLSAVIAGWTPNALNIGGLDNLLFLSLFPFVVIRLELYRFGSKSWSTSLGLVFLATAMFYAYPEGIAIASVIFLPFFCQSVWSGIYRRGRAWRQYVISSCLVLILIPPGAKVFVDTLVAHFGAGMSKAVSGIFPGLLSPRFLPAMLGLGQEYPGTMYSPHDLVLPIIMLAFIVFGCATWIRRRKNLILVFSIFIMMAIWQGLLLQSDYGLYKILFIGSLVWIPALFLGGTAVASFVPRPRRPFAVTLGILIFCSWAFAQRMEQKNKIPWTRVTPIKWYSELANLRHMVGNRSLLFVCDNVFDQEHAYFDQDWALFFLRRANLKVSQYIGMLGLAFGPLMQRAKSFVEPPAFVLVNGPLEGAVWKNERFSLFELADRAKIIGIQAPTGQHVNGRPFVWLGNTAARFLIVSRIEQTSIFSAWCLTGPSRPVNKDRQIRISTGGKVWQADASGSLSIQVPLKPGLNVLDIVCQDPGTNSADSNGETIALPLGLWDYRIADREEVSN